MFHRYKVITSAQADLDIANLVDYIVTQYGAPETAAKKVDLIQQALHDLVEHPHWHHEYEHNPWHGEKLYVYLVDRYKLIHQPADERRETTVLRVLHQLQDTAAQLN